MGKCRAESLVQLFFYFPSLLYAGDTLSQHIIAG